MRIAIPLVGGRLSAHFGHSEEFALVDVDEATKTPTETKRVTPPPHEPGVIPQWLHEQEATIIIAGGMGQRAQMMFAEKGIEVLVGAPSHTPDEIVTAYVNGTLDLGRNSCDH